MGVWLERESGRRHTGGAEERTTRGSDRDRKYKERKHRPGKQNGCTSFQPSSMEKLGYLPSGPAILLGKLEREEMGRGEEGEFGG